MIWGAPIWLNEFLVYAVKLIINLLYLYIPIISIYLIYKLIVLIVQSIKVKKNMFNSKSNIYLIYLTLSVIFSIALIIVYFIPQSVIPDNLKLYSFAINRSNELSISDKNKLEELKSILNEYKCRRGLDDREFSYNHYTAIEIDFITFLEDGQMKPIHIIISDDVDYRYSLGGIDFFYFIEDKDNTLRDRITSFIEDL